MHIVKDTPETTIFKTETQLKNQFCSIRYNEEGKELTGIDLTDLNNVPSFFTKTKRGVNKAWEELNASFNEGTKYSTALDIILKKVRVHTYCAMD